MTLVEEYEAELEGIERGGPRIDGERLLQAMRSILCIPDDAISDPSELACAAVELTALGELVADERRRVFAAAPVEVVTEAAAIIKGWTGRSTTH